MYLYLRSTAVIDFDAPSVLQRAAVLAAGSSDHIEIARDCFEWVRDCIDHSGDHRADVTTCCASEVLRERTGWCYAKAHLLVALLRANRIPAGLCYQRLRIDEQRFALHGLAAVYLAEIGWYRIDPRGNKAGVDAQFRPPAERLAFSAQSPGECDFPEIWPDPAPLIIDCLGRFSGWEQVMANLPDIAVIGSGLEQ